MNKPQLLLTSIAASALLAACGGGGDSMPAPPVAPLATDAVPAGASESSAGLATYVKDLAAASADDKEPADLSTFAPKTPDDTEPEPVG